MLIVRTRAGPFPPILTVGEARTAAMPLVGVSFLETAVLGSTRLLLSFMMALLSDVLPSQAGRRKAIDEGDGDGWSGNKIDNVAMDARGVNSQHPMVHVRRAVSSCCSSSIRHRCLLTVACGCQKCDTRLTFTARTTVYSRQWMNGTQLVYTCTCVQLKLAAATVCGLSHTLSSLMRCVISI